MSETDILLCEYAVKLTSAPATVSENDVQKLRDNGFNDEQITIAAQVIAYFNYINRIADGLGVKLEKSMTLSKEDWCREKASDYKGKGN